MNIFGREIDFLIIEIFNPHGIVTSIVVEGAGVNFAPLFVRELMEESESVAKVRASTCVAGIGELRVFESEIKDGVVVHTIANDIRVTDQEYTDRE